MQEVHVHFIFIYYFRLIFRTSEYSNKFRPEIFWKRGCWTLWRNIRNFPAERKNERKFRNNAKTSHFFTVSASSAMKTQNIATILGRHALSPKQLLLQFYKHFFQNYEQIPQTFFTAPLAPRTWKNDKHFRKNNFPQVGSLLEYLWIQPYYI